MNELYVVFEVTVNGHERIAYSVRTEKEARTIVEGVSRRLFRIDSKNKVICRKYVSEGIEESMVMC